MESSASAGRVASAVLDPRRWWALALLCGALFMVLPDWVAGPLSSAAIRSGHHEGEQARGKLARALRHFLVTPM